MFYSSSPEYLINHTIQWIPVSSFKENSTLLQPPNVAPVSVFNLATGQIGSPDMRTEEISCINWTLRLFIHAHVTHKPNYPGTQSQELSFSSSPAAIQPQQELGCRWLPLDHCNMCCMLCDGKQAEQLQVWVETVSLTKEMSGKYNFYLTGERSRHLMTPCWCVWYPNTRWIIL